MERTLKSVFPSEPLTVPSEPKFSFTASNDPSKVGYLIGGVCCKAGLPKVYTFNIMMNPKSNTGKSNTRSVLRRAEKNPLRICNQEHGLTWFGFIAQIYTTQMVK